MTSPHARPAAALLVVASLSLAFAAPAQAQSSAPGASPGAAAPSSVRQKPAVTPRPPAARVGGPNVANLTKQECRKLGGTLQNDTKCKNAQRCVITLANGDVNSICIDEVKGESK
jgi:hypothetical protein